MGSQVSKGRRAWCEPKPSSSLYSEGLGSGVSTVRSAYWTWSQPNRAPITDTTGWGLKNNRHLFNSGGWKSKIKEITCLARASGFIGGVSSWSSQVVEEIRVLSGAPLGH